MTQELKKAFQHIYTTSKPLGITLITSQELNSANKNIEELEDDIKSLKLTIDKITPNNTNELAELIAHLNISLVDILTDLENIHGVLVKAAKNIFE